MAEHLIVTDIDGNGTYTQEELEAMTKAEILAAATQLGYNMTTTEASTKAEIIADFLAQQTA